MTPVRGRTAAGAVLVLAVLASACGRDVRTEGSWKPRVEAELRSIAAGARQLPSGALWIPMLSPTARGELWLAALGLERAVGAETTADGRRATPLSVVLEESGPDGLTIALPALMVAMSGPAGDTGDGEELRSGIRRLVDARPEPSRSISDLRLGALTGRIVEPRSEDARTACDRFVGLVDSHTLEANTWAGVALAHGGGGACDPVGDELAQRWCADDTDLDLSTNDTVLDLVALAPQARATLAGCARQKLLDAVAQVDRADVVDVQEWLQVVSAVAWLAAEDAAGRSMSTDVATSRLVTEARRVVEDRGRSQFPSATATMTFEEAIVAWGLEAAGVVELDRPLAEPATLPTLWSVSGATASRPCQDAVVVMPVDVAAASPLESIEWLAAATECRTFGVDVASGDPQVLLRAFLAASVVGCRRSGVAADVLGVGRIALGADDPLRDDPFPRYLSAVSVMPVRERCDGMGLG